MTALIDRFDDPLYTLADGARFADVPASTLATWAHGYVRRPPGRPAVTGAPIITVTGRSTGKQPVLPFIGLVEALTLAAIRRTGVPLQRIRPALDALEKEFGLPHALANRRLHTDGAEVLYDLGEHSADDRIRRDLRSLVVVRNGQRVLTEVVQEYLREVVFDRDGYAESVQLPAYAQAHVVVDPLRGFGQPIFASGGARLDDAIAMFRAGESIAVVADEYGMAPSEFEDAVRVVSRPAA